MRHDRHYYRHPLMPDRPPPFPFPGFFSSRLRPRPSNHEVQTRQIYSLGTECPLRADMILSNFSVLMSVVSRRRVSASASSPTMHRASWHDDVGLSPVVPPADVQVALYWLVCCAKSQGLMFGQCPPYTPSACLLAGRQPTYTCCSRSLNVGQRHKLISTASGSLGN